MKNLFLALSLVCLVACNTKTNINTANYCHTVTVNGKIDTLYSVSFVVGDTEQTSDILKKAYMLECMEQSTGGDYSCDSCYYAVYGENIDTYSLFE